MNHFSFDDIQRKDLFTALGLWLTVELVSFVFFPLVGLINPGARLRTWFLISIPLGVGGALLMSLSSRFMAIASETNQKSSKPMYRLLGQFGGWIGLAGIMFPFYMVCVEFFSNLKL